MSTIAIFSLLIGSLLGGRFRVFILPPAIVLGAALIGGMSAWQGQGPAHTVGMILLFATVLQLGYFCGAILSRARVVGYRGKAAPSFDGSSLS
ncbi:hypothetical protein G8O24_06190 [Bradyrhizobium sp. INPA01-394B]|uniref:Uncharacterized protein n=1 Tax=Bradyrhizobium campsiandrae TaxID=1729892 RepID=A0ABR7U8K2_9BRAD|nr:hypothetical protein [Bradyrhizobium campsiandrae]MBC9876938.1 hypothetical protein [Bradyrhizobium campsiandrae]MBC9979737.1 hypothetical protein [Bradyrhizobium campsiandrae]